MRKLLILLSMTFILSGSLSAQVDKGSYKPHGEIYHSEDTTVVRGKKGAGWIRAHFFDDWFIQAQGGGQLYYGTDDRKGAFGDRITGNAEIQIGRYIYPMFGFRIGLGYGYAHGFLAKEHHVGVTGGTGECGTDANGNSYGGYYWDYNDDLLMQKWKYYYFGGDLFLNLALFNGSEHYDPFKHWSHIIYGGAHTKFGLSETDSKNHRSEAHLGYILQYNINSNWSIYADARLSFMERLFDREWVPRIETSGWGVDLIGNLHIGVVYKFHIRTEEERARFESKERRSAIAQESSHFLYIKIQDTSYVSISDTIISTYNHDTVPTLAMMDTLYKLNNDIASILAAIKKREDGELDTNMLGLLLPYEQVFFERDKWDILPDEATKIEKMVQIMNAFPETKYILIGSADSITGTKSRNTFLGHVRADVVYNSLVTEYSIDSSRLSREYKGGIMDYIPFELNRCTVILLDHPYVRRIFMEMKAKGQAGGRDVYRTF